MNSLALHPLPPPTLRILCCKPNPGPRGGHREGDGSHIITMAVAGVSPPEEVSRNPWYLQQTCQWLEALPHCAFLQKTYLLPTHSGQMSQTSNGLP
jgi:hypothetical protein